MPIDATTATVLGVEVVAVSMHTDIDCRDCPFVARHKCAEVAKGPGCKDVYYLLPDTYALKLLKGQL